MATKSKTLITNNPKLKILSLFIIFLCASIGFEAWFNLIFNPVERFRNLPIQKYIFFGNVVYRTYYGIRNNMFQIVITNIILIILAFIIYRFNKNTKIKLFEFIIDKSSKFTLESFLLFIALLLGFRYINWSSTLPYYDNILITFDFIILLALYFTINSILYSRKNLKDRFITLKFIKDIISKHNKKTLSKKILSIMMLATLLQFIFTFIFLLTRSGRYYYPLALIYSLISCIFTFSCYVYIYNILSKKLNYLSYISKNIKNVESGNLDYKLDIIGDDEISSIASSVNNMTSGLENALDEKLKSEKMKTELITNVSHDLKTPLTSIVSYIDILKNNELDKNTTKDYLNILDRKAQRLKTLVEDIFEASKITSGDIELNIEKTDIKELLIQSIVELEDKIEKSKLDFIINTSDTTIFTNIDGKRTFRVFENLINNITKYSLLGTRVYIDLSVVDDNVYIIMKNISNHRLNITSDELLERFVRGDVSRNTDGSGLGLSIAKNLVELQNGSFSLDVDGDLFKVIIKFKVIN